jgi:DNA/RNA-binding domain of Phe-tRNA-synthetase-like protein
MLQATDRWKEAFPGASVGILVMRNAANPVNHVDLDARMTEVESDIRARYSEGGRPVIRAVPTMQAYAAYYRKFKKTYHVQGQIESVALKNSSLPRISTLVSAMFTAELKNHLLTAGHDVGALQLPVTLDVSTGDETYTKMNGKEQALSPGDMFISDALGVMSSIIYGPDSRTPITSGTSDVLFTAYGPEGISAQQMTGHLEDIRDFVKLASPDAHIETLEVVSQ